MSDHTIRLVIENVSRFDEVDRLVALRIRHYTGWTEDEAHTRARSDQCHVVLTPVGDPPRGRGRQRYRAEVEVVV